MVQVGIRPDMPAQKCHIFSGTPPSGTLSKTAGQARDPDLGWVDPGCGKQFETESHFICETVTAPATL